MKKLLFKYKLELILFLSLILRLVHLNQSLWLDEAAQAIESARPLRDQLNIVADFHPPLYHLFLHFWMYLGKSEIWIRFPSVLFGIGSIFFIYLIVSALGKRNIGILTALFMALSPFNIWYSQEARPYIFFVFLSLWATFSLIKNRWLIYTILLTLSLYCFYFAPFLLISHLAYIYFFDRKSLKNFFITSIISIILFLPWLPSFWEQLKIGTGGLFSGWTNVVSMPVIKAIPQTFAKFIFGKGTLNNKLYYALIILPSFIIFLVSVVQIWKNKEGKIAISLFFIPLILAGTVSFFIPILAPQRLIFLLPYFYLIMALGINCFPKKLKTLSFLIILITSVSGIVQYYVDPNIQREQWRQAVEFIEKNPDSHNLALFVFPDPFAPYLWYSHRNIEALGIAPKFILQDKDLVSLNSRLEDKNKIFLFQYLTGLTDPGNKASKYLISQGFYEVKVDNFPGVGFIYTYEKK